MRLEGHTFFTALAGPNTTVRFIHGHHVLRLQAPAHTPPPACCTSSPERTRFSSASYGADGCIHGNWASAFTRSPRTTRCSEMTRCSTVLQPCGKQHTDILATGATRLRMCHVDRQERCILARAICTSKQSPERYTHRALNKCAPDGTRSSLSAPQTRPAAPLHKHWTSSTTRLTGALVNT